MKENQQLTLIIALATLARSIIAVSIGLGNDEVYYLTYAQHLQWNYFDHPPMVALLIRLTTFNLNLTNELFVRLGSIIFGAVNTYLIYYICKGIKNKKCGFNCFVALFRFLVFEHNCRSIYFTGLSSIIFLAD